MLLNSKKTGFWSKLIYTYEEIDFLANTAKKVQNIKLWILSKMFHFSSTLKQEWEVLMIKVHARYYKKA